MQHELINYLEYPAKYIEKTKQFFAAVFNWQFTDYGPEYTAFSKAETGIDGGFYLSDQTSNTDNGACLTVFYSDDLTQTETKIIEHGGKIKVPTFEFPGGKRFHFTDPNGNEFAVWSE